MGMGGLLMAPAVIPTITRRQRPLHHTKLDATDARSFF